MRHFIHIFNCLLVTFAAEASPTYEFVDLGTLGGATSYSQSFGINNRGQVVGQASTSNGWYHAVLFSGTGTANIDLGTPGGAASAAYAINDCGIIVGGGFYSNNREYATIFTPGEQPSITSLIGEQGSVAYDINNRGQIVGGMTDAAGRPTAATFNSGQHDIEGLGFFPNQANAINNNGQIVGESRTSNFDVNAFRATHFLGTIESNIDLGALGDTSPFSRAFDNNDSGQSVGRSYGPGNQHATLFAPGGNVNLDPDGRGFHTASGINSHGQIVGDAFFWEAGQLYALTDIVAGIPNGWDNLRVLTAGGDKINDWGQIAATIFVPGQGDRALLLNPRAPNVFATPGGGFEIKFVAGMGYSLFAGATGSATTATFLAGEAGSGGHGAFGLNRNVSILFPSADPGVSLVSDIVSVEGTESDTFVMALSYDAGHSDDGSVSLYWRDESDGSWKLAVEGNSGVRGALAGSYDLSFVNFLAEFNNGEFDASLMLGAHGSADGHSWAVLNHNSDFGIGANSLNHPPVAEAGSDQTVAEGSPVTLHGEDSFDLDGDSFSYAWVQIENGSPAVLLTGANTANPTFTAPIVGQNGAPGVVATLIFELRVDDGNPQDQPAPGFTFANVVDRVTVEITNVNNLPVASADADQTVNESSAVVLSGALSSDPDSDSLTYMWAQVANGAPTVVLTGATTVVPEFTAPFVGIGGADFEFELTVDDGYGGIDTDTVVIHVQNINDPPLASAAQPTVATLWPPNHGLVSVGITGVSDPNDDATIAITGVTQDEPASGLGDGDTPIDAIINADGTVLLRAERSGSGDGRVYRIAFTASDLEGSSTGVVIVKVPHSVKKPAIDSEGVFPSTE
jgi:probable HAF family extracellular repeat protein